MKRLKCSILVLLLGVLSLFLPCMLLVSNTSALKLTNIRTSNVQMFNYSVDNPTATYTDQSVTLGNSSLYTSTVPVNKVFDVKNMVIRTASSLSSLT